MYVLDKNSGFGGFQIKAIRYHRWCSSLHHRDWFQKSHMFFFMDQGYLTIHMGCIYTNLLIIWLIPCGCQKNLIRYR